MFEVEADRFTGKDCSSVTMGISTFPAGKSSRVFQDGTKAGSANWQVDQAPLTGTLNCSQIPPRCPLGW